MVAHQPNMEPEGFATSTGFSRLSGQGFDTERVGLCLGTLGKVIMVYNLCSGIELWSTFSKYTNPDKLKHSPPACPFAVRNALSAPVTTCAPVKLHATSTCSNTLVIDAGQALLSAWTALSTPQATTTPSLPPGWS